MVEGNVISWLIPPKYAEKVKISFDLDNMHIIRIDCPENIKVSVNLHELFYRCFEQYLKSPDVVKQIDYSMTGFEEWLSGSDSYYPVELMDMIKHHREVIDERIPQIIERLDSIYDKNPIVWVDWLYCVAQGIGAADSKNTFWQYLASKQNNLTDISFDSRFQCKEHLLEMMEKSRHDQ